VNVITLSAERSYFFQHLRRSFPSPRTGPQISRGKHPLPGLLQPEASMATKQPRSKTGRTSVPDIDVRDHLTKRFKLWLMANGDDARTEALHQLLARTYRSGKRKVPRTKS
jgi:hypothetical protein